MTDDDKFFWLKAVFAIIAALVCSTSPVPIGKIGIGIAILIYLATFPVAVYLLKIPTPKEGGAWIIVRKMILTGLITYLFIFMVVSGVIFSFTSHPIS